MDNLVRAMLEKLPASGMEWEPAKRKIWLSMMAQVFQLVYGGDDEIEIQVRVSDLMRASTLQWLAEREERTRKSKDVP